MERIVIVRDRIQMFVITEPPVKTSMNFSKLRVGKGVSALEGADSIRFCGISYFFFG